MQGLFRGFLLCAAAGALLCASPSLAAKDIQAALKEKKAEQAKTEKKAKEIGKEIDTLKLKLVELSRELRENENGLSATEFRLKELQSRKSACLQSLYKDQEALGSLVTAARRYNGLSTSQMLMQSRPIDAARAALVMKSMLPSLQAHADIFRAQLVEISHIEADITLQRVKEAKEADKIREQKQKLAALLEDRGNIYKLTESERKAQEAEVARLAKEARNIQELVSKIQPRTKPVKSASGYRLPASIVPPVPGKIATGFGETDDLGAKSEGVTFSTRAETTVVTPLAGKVKFAGPFQKYKQILIVEHPGGYHSLIAGLGRVDTVVGAALSAGEPVGAAEKSATSRIYYELRLNGDPVNPQKLTIAQKKQGKT